MIAAGAIGRAAAGKRLWNIGGCEYCTFWAICCIVVALHGWAGNA
jgi:hypothetical protein